MAAEIRGRAGTAVPDAAASYPKREEGGWGAGTAVPDTVASYISPPTHFKRKFKREAYPRTTARGGSKERERARLCQTQRHHTLNREGLAYAKQRMAAERRGGAGTAVPDTAASYTPTREEGWGAGTSVPATAASYALPPTHFNRKPEGEACLRTTARGGRKERENGHSCARHRSIIHSTERA